MRYFPDVYLQFNWNYASGRNIVKRLRRHYSVGIDIFYGDVFAGGDYVMGQYIMSDEGFSMVEKILARIAKGHKK